MHYFDWHARAACRDHNPDMWHPDPADVHTRRAAQAICGTCPVLKECGKHALETGEPDGIWAGLTGAQRSKILGTPARDRQKTTATHLLQPCGTEAAYRRHLRHGEQPCPACAEANSRGKAKRRGIHA